MYKNTDQIDKGIMIKEWVLGTWSYPLLLWHESRVSLFWKSKSLTQSDIYDTTKGHAEV